ncbi:MAG: carbamate kinase, partial [Nitrospinaceae bacterium]|nr:carbamate kinase [Nitrospinaceae bacterium]NIR54885.1 carbamate kinase [Nitrospinaceae bacterium]NIT82123.1 carbamate kinase [Nitrospinaceae bacterium]NIX34516.1 carbamate kinase [Nitrospinaceae bacterium]NIY15336.1 carbamate kinase [Nitrospinaceae bacterium]
TAQIAAIIAAGNPSVITHGNGPQVGFILRRSEIASEVAHMHTVPLVSCDADTQGAIGYQIQQSLDNEFRDREMDTQAVTIVTQVLVDEEDPAFSAPEKPIGQYYSKEEYEKILRLQPD